MNEPSGYSDTDWTNFAAGFLAHFPNVPRGRIVVAGTGNDLNVAVVGADSRLNGTLLSFHLYSVFGIVHTTEQAWVNEIMSHLGSYASRTIITEFGVPMTTGVNYDGPRDGDNNTSYLYAMTDTARNLGMGLVYWPGLRAGDWFSMETLNGSGTNLYSHQQQYYRSGPPQVWIWPDIQFSGGGGGGGTTYYKIINRNSGQALDISGGSTSNGGKAIQWPYSGGANQQWQEVSANGGYKLVNRNSGLLLDDPGGQRPMAPSWTNGMTPMVLISGGTSFQQGMVTTTWSTRAVVSTPM